MSKGPDFQQKTKETLAKRAGQICSNPDCRKRTSGAHSNKDKALNLGEAAHIKAAREGEARFDPDMTDEERSDISNGIWLCRECARKIDLDEEKYPVELLLKWKEDHEKWVLEKHQDDAGREVRVKNGGVGSIVTNEGEGIALDIEHQGKGLAERIVVEGPGVGEIIINTGQGTGKRIISKGAPASETHVIVNKPVNKAMGLGVKSVIKSCDGCGQTVRFSKVIQGFAGNKEPESEVRCPYCGRVQLI